MSACLLLDGLSCWCFERVVFFACCFSLCESTHGDSGVIVIVIVMIDVDYH